MRRFVRVFQAAIVTLSMIFASSGFSTSALKRLYLASPLGFSEAGKYFKDHVLKQELIRLGFEVIDPWELVDPRKINPIFEMPYGIERREAWRRLNSEIGRKNQEEIDRAD